MLLIAPSCDAFKRAVIANALSSISSNNGIENIIVDFSVPGTDAFWSLYKGGMKYVEDILPVLSGINHKMLKSFLSSGINVILGLKNTKLQDLPVESIVYLAGALESNYKNVIVILPDNIESNSYELMKRSKMILMPFMSDAISAKSAMMAAESHITSAASGLNLFPFKLDIGLDFHSEKILNRSELFKNCVTADFDLKSQEKILSPKYSYRDKSASFVEALSKILTAYESDAVKKMQAEDASGNYFNNEEVYKSLRDKIHAELVEMMKEYADETDTETLKKTARNKIEEIIKRLDLKLPAAVSEKLFKELCDDVAGLGVLEDFLKDAAVTEIMVNGPKNIYIEKAGKLFESPVTFPDEKRLKTVIERIVSQIGRHIDEASPIVDARLKDGSRVNAVIRPISLNGPALTIRKFLKNKLSADALISSGSISKEMVEFLKTAVILKRNIIISGGTGTGKTTLLNAVSSFIPDKERLVTIEDSAELQLQQKHVVRLESRPKSTEGTGEVSIRRLVVNALRMRPDRIIVGECRSGEALDMIQSMLTGHEGSMSTVHANSESDAISRLATMVLMSGLELPERSIVSQIASAINVIVQLTRYSDGSRKISSISVVNKTDDDKQYEIKPVFKFNLKGFENGVQKGDYNACGYVPEFIKTASASGVEIDMGIFK